jgi:hypothetical protein
VVSYFLIPMAHHREKERMHNPITRFRVFLINCLSGLLIVTASNALADTISFSHDDFTLTPVFNSLTAFNFSIEVDGALAPGSYTNPVLLGVDYSVNGVLTEATPSGFPSFNLVRTIGGSEIYLQGSSLEFVISAAADFSDGLQITEFETFIFDGREVDTGRYHPALLQFGQNGTDSIRNSNNSGGINPGSGEVVNVDFGDEYIVDLSFQPALVPIPATFWLFGSAIGLLGWLRLRNK